MHLKKILSETLVIGFITGLVNSIFFEILPNKYFQYKMHKLIALAFQYNINKWIIISFSALIILLIVIWIARTIWKLAFLKAIEIQIRDKKWLKKILIGFSFCLILACILGWAANYTRISSYLPFSRNFFVTIGLIISIIYIVILLFYFNHLEKMALFILIIIIIMNGSIFVIDNMIPPQGPNIVLISIDTLRADHLGCYGYNRNTSPNLDAFGVENILFKNCFVQDDLTLPSHMSMLTSLYPLTHKVNEKSSLDLSINTLAEYLKNNSYYTMGFVRHCIWMDAEFGFNQGFNHYLVKDYHPKHPEFNAEFQNKVISQYLQKYNKKKIFLFVHYYDVHSDYMRLPYDAPSKYKNLFYPDYQGNFQGGFGDTFASKYFQYLNGYRIKLKPDDLKYIISLYDSGISYTDKCIGELFNILKENDLYNNTLIIITADHGEEFQEHSFLLHGDNLFYNEIMRVPLMIKLPIQKNINKEINELVESIDLMPSILEFLGIKSNNKMQGSSFLGLINGETEWKEYIFAFGSYDKTFIRNERWKLTSDNIEREDGLKLFDLMNDPIESYDVKNKYPQLTEQLYNKLIQKRNNVKYFLKNNKQIDNSITLDEEQIKKLKSLGYLK